MDNFFDFTVKDKTGSDLNLNQFKGKTTLVVNVASKCGFTPQYKSLEALYKKFKDQGFVVLGFPCNQFNSQEPGSNEEIQSFCELNFGVSFPILAKIDVNGNEADPVFTWLKNKAPGVLGTKSVKWNFTKFLVSADGTTVKRFAPNDTIESFEKDVEALVSK